MKKIFIIIVATFGLISCGIFEGTYNQGITYLQETALRGDGQKLVPLKLYWSSRRQDNQAIVTSNIESDAFVVGYRYIRVEACIFSTEQSGTIALNHSWNVDRKDSSTRSNVSSIGDLAAEGYRFIRPEGYILKTAQPGTVPLILYWNSTRKDYLLVASRQGIYDAEAARYTLLRVEGYAYPASDC